MPEMFIEVWDHIIFFRLEILCAVVLFALEILRRKHGSNKVIAAFVDFMSKQVVERMEAQEGKPLGQTDSRRKRVKRNVRRQIAKQARKANRGKVKGQKRGS